MKYLIGILATVLVLFLTLYMVLRIWDIEMFSHENLTKLLYSLGIMVVAAVFLLVVIIFPIFGNPGKGYDKNGQGIAQRKL